MITPNVIDLRSDRFRDQVLGCWMGKNCGGTLGAPLEKMWGEAEPFDIWWYPQLREGGIPNDDLEMQLIWLVALEDIGPRLQAADLAQYWLDHIGYNWDEYGLSKTNLRLGLLPPVSGAYNNWFKDCMGSPIRSEIWACVAPGIPRLAVRYAYEDAICDHAGGEGVYGELFNAAVESAAFVVSDRNELLDIGLSYIPPQSKSAQAIAVARAAFADGVDWREARRRVLAATPHYNAQYAPINLGFQVIGWLYGDEFGDALCKAVNCGYDTDCTGATLGSILGIIAGSGQLPQRWTAPLGSTISTNSSWDGVRHIERLPTTIDEMTERVCRMAQQVLTAFGQLGDDAKLTIDPATLYATDVERALWDVTPMQLTYPGSSISVTVDYGTTPAVIPASTKSITATLTNPHPDPITVTCALRVPADWEADNHSQTLTVPAQATATTEWQVPIPAANKLDNSNTVLIDVQPQSRPAQNAIPLVFIGAHHYRSSGPYTLEDGGDQELLAHAFPPEQHQGIALTATARPGEWHDVFALDNAVPLHTPFAGTGAMYVQTFLWSPTEQTVLLGTSATCPFKIWINGTFHSERLTYGLLRPNYGGKVKDGFAAVLLREGWNEVLLKYVRDAASDPFDAHLLYSTADELHNGLPAIGRTRVPWGNA